MFIGFTLCLVKDTEVTSTTDAQENAVCLIIPNYWTLLDSLPKLAFELYADVFIWQGNQV